MRPVGALDKNKAFLLNRLKDMYGDDFDPVMMAAKNAYEMQEMATVELTDDQIEEMSAKEYLSVTDTTFMRKKECVAAWDKISSYVAPKLKAVELTGEDGGPIKAAVTVSFNPVGNKDG